MTTKHDGEAGCAAKLREAALPYHAFGMNVIPVNGSKRPVGSWRDANEIAQTASDVAALPWAEASGIGVVTGPVSGGLACLDADGVEDREVVAGSLLSDLGLDAEYGWLVLSPGGLHVWFYAEGIEELLGEKGKLVVSYPGCKQLELRYTGHQTLVPPTVRSDGGCYEFVNGAPTWSPDRVELARVEAVLGRSGEVDQVCEAADQPHLLLQPYVQAALDGELKAVRAAEEGSRNETLNRAAYKLGQLTHLGGTIEQVSAQLIQAARACGLPITEARATIASGLQAGMRSPRNPESNKAEGGSFVVSSSYPIEAIPEPLRTYAIEAAESVGCPVEMVAVPLLTYAATTIGRSYRIEVSPSYAKYPVLWTAVVAEPGAGKSPADAFAREPLEVLQAEAQNNYEDDLRAYQEEHRQWKDDGDSGPPPAEPVLEHFFTTDATIEAIAPMVSCSAGLAVSHDELVGFVKSMDAYNGTPGRDRAQYMTLWAGRSLKVDRKGKAKTIFVKDPVVCVTGGVQPERLVDLSAEEGRQDGFIERFLWSCPETRPTSWSDRAISESVKEGTLRVFVRLRRSTPTEEPVALSSEAKAYWCGRYDDYQAKAHQLNGSIRGFYAKADVHLARIALVLHVLAHQDPAAVELSAETLEAAARIVDYHLGQAEAVLARLSRREGTASVSHRADLRGRVLGVLQEDGGWVSGSEIVQRLGGHVSADKRDAVLTRLFQEGLVESRVKESGEKGGAPAMQWRLCERRRNDETTVASVA